MPKKWGIGLLLGIGLFALILLTQTSASFMDIFLQPFQSLWGSNQQLQLRMIEVTEKFEPAGRRLIKPFGDVHLERTLPAKSLLANSQDSDASKKISPPAAPD